ncbi:SDR family oxidoreductase [Rhizobium sp. AB2/73]|uniref:SDR family oxidoreductase n=1 Tax=Rhizobium sp. AB2/73 TaxID=2795216 RepID=UPI001C5F72B4|nr:SDR family oxidoreductase [Rhizobium sp. AB2/73]QYA11927.1 SDR family oxidoreductase [Rhizobium sp. AB2/73]UEQ82142.1 SDR family oxidoreductase [Rhizobium sp. AB2/73]
MSKLADQTVVIVGASSGIGLATAQLAAAKGANAVMLSRSQTKLDHAASLVTGERRAMAMNMLDAEAVDRVIGSLSRIDHLVLTAVADELKQRAEISHITNEQVERTLDKLRGYVNVVRASVPAMASRGTITLLSGGSAVKPPIGFSVLAAVNASMTSFGRALALELAPIRVNVLMAGVVDTPINQHRREQLQGWAESKLPARHFGQPEDVANAILFLMTNPYMTGHTLNVDGGFVIS